MVCGPNGIRKRHYPRKRRRRRRGRQQGGTLARHRPRMVDKIAECMAMALSGPAPTFASLGMLLGKQALKGVTDHVRHYRRRR